MDHEPTEEEWRELARQATKEEDPEKLVALAEQMVEAFDAEKRRPAPGFSFSFSFKLDAA